VPIQRAVYSKLNTRLNAKLNKPPQAPEARCQCRVRLPNSQKKIEKEICIVMFLGYLSLYRCSTPPRGEEEEEEDGRRRRRIYSHSMIQ
jgi:hypothetical protein